MTLQPFDYLEPKSLDEANAALGEYGSPVARICWS